MQKKIDYDKLADITKIVGAIFLEIILIIWCINHCTPLKIGISDAVFLENVLLYGIITVAVTFGVFSGTVVIVYAVTELIKRNRKKG